MTYSRLSWLCAAALALGCSAGVKGQTGTGGATTTGAGGSGGATASGGRGGNSSTGGSTGSGGQSTSGGVSGTDASPGRRLRGFHRRRSARAAGFVLPDGQLEVDGRPDRRRHDQVGGRELGAEHLLHRRGFHRPGCRAEILPRRAGQSPGHLFSDLRLHGQRHQLRRLRLPRHLRPHRGIHDQRLSAVPGRQHLRQPDLLAHQELQRRHLLRRRAHRAVDGLRRLHRLPRLLPPARHLHRFAIRDPEREAGDPARRGQRAQQLTDRALAGWLHPDRTGAGRGRHVGRSSSRAATRRTRWPSCW